MAIIKRTELMKTIKHVSSTCTSCHGSNTIQGVNRNVVSVQVETSKIARLVTPIITKDQVIICNQHIDLWRTSTPAALKALTTIDCAKSYLSAKGIVFADDEKHVLLIKRIKQTI